MDPYKELGVSPDDSDEDIKRAYRELVKKYHPDKYTGTPLEQNAQERLKRINMAYDDIQKQRKGGGARFTGGYRPGGGDASWGGASGGSPTYAAIRDYINRRMVAEAEVALDAITARDAEWYYLRGLCYFQRGWYDQAESLFNHAVSLDPNNAEYRQAVARMNAINRGYSRPYARVNMEPRSLGLCSLCLCMQCVGSMCGRGFCAGC